MSTIPKDPEYIYLSEKRLDVGIIWRAGKREMRINDREKLIIGVFFLSLKIVIMINKINIALARNDGE